MNVAQRDWLGFSSWIAPIEMLGAIVLMGYVLAALLALIPRGDIVTSRIAIADGAIASLSVKLAATLLKTILLQSWTQIGMFVVILALRTLLKRIFEWERQKLLTTHSHEN